MGSMLPVLQCAIGLVALNKLPVVMDEQNAQTQSPKTV